MSSTISLPSSLTMGSASAELSRLREQLSKASDDRVSIDGGALAVFDSSAIAVLLDLRREGLRRDVQLQVQNLPPRLRDLMALYGVAELLPA